MISKELQQGLLLVAILAAMAMPASASLLAYYPFEDGTGSATAADASGNGHTGTVRATTDLSGIYDAYGPDGSGGLYVEYYGAVDLGTWDPGTEFTVTGWAAMNPGLNMLVTKSDASGDRWRVLATTQDGLAGIRYENGAQAAYGTTTAWTWQHFAVTRDASGSKVYLDGALAATGGSYLGSNTGASLQIGNLWDGKDKGAMGVLDDIAIFDTVLSDAEVQDIYLNGITVPEPSALAMLVLGGLAMLIRRHAR